MPITYNPLYRYPESAVSAQVQRIPATLFRKVFQNHLSQFYMRIMNSSLEGQVDEKGNWLPDYSEAAYISNMNVMAIDGREHSSSFIRNNKAKYWISIVLANPFASARTLLDVAYKIGLQPANILRYSVELGQLNIINLLSRSNNHLNFREMLIPNGFEVFQVCIPNNDEKKSLAMVKLFLKYLNENCHFNSVDAARINVDPWIISGSRASLVTLFSQACAKNYTSVIDAISETFLSSGLQAQYSLLIKANNYQPWRVAARNGHFYTLITLLKYLPIEIQMEDLLTAERSDALYQAVTHAHMDVIRFLVKITPFPVLQKQFMQLMRLVKCIDTMALVFNNQVFSKLLSANDYSVFNLISKENNIPVLKCLIKYAELLGLPAEHYYAQISLGHLDYLKQKSPIASVTVEHLSKMGLFQHDASIELTTSAAFKKKNISPDTVILSPSFCAKDHLDVAPSLYSNN